ncbi:MAG: tetratricopeptide repeat protein [Pirellulaceae bacterium]
MSVLACCGSTSVLSGNPASLSTANFNGAVVQEQEDSVTAEERQFELSAVTSQNSGEFREAESIWKKLIEKYPDSLLKGDALSNLGICQIQLGNFQDAIENLRAGIRATDPAKKTSLARANLYLGFGHFQLGKQAQDAGDETAANRNLTTAADSLQRVVVDFPEFENVDEASYFQAMALERMGHQAEAISAYKSVLKAEGTKFKFETFFALGDLLSKQNQHEEALAYLKQYIDAGTTKPDIDNVRLAAADSMWALAQQARTEGDDARFQQLSAQAVDELAAVNDSADALIREQAYFERGLIEHSRGNREQAINAFKLAKGIDGGKQHALAGLNLGQLYLESNQRAEAVAELESVLSGGTTLAVEAAHQLALILIKDDPQRSLALAAEWVEKTEDDEMKAKLLMDQGNALLEIPDRVGEAVKFFDAAAARSTTLAPVATYNAAFAALMAKQWDSAIQLTNRFMLEFVAHDLTDDVIEVRAEALMGKNEFGAALPLFKQLVSDYSDNKKNPLWHVRLATAQYLSDDFSGVVATLESRAATLDDVSLRSQALHWLGMAEWKLDQEAKAIVDLTASLEAGKWDGQADTLLALTRLHLKNNDVDSAEALVSRLESEYDGSTACQAALYAIADRLIDSGETERGQAFLAKAAEMPGAGALTGHAQLKQAWLSFDAGRFDQAKNEFQSALNNAHDDVGLKNRARLGLASIAKADSDWDTAIRELDTIIAEAGDDVIGVDARFESALVAAASGNRGDAATRLESLLATSEATGIERDLRYELAWVYNDLQKTSEAAGQFQLLAEKFPETAMGADASFQLAEMNYSRGEYEDALPGYASAAQHGPETLQEKALYKSGWALFHLGRFAESEKQFQQQADTFPNGPLFADGLYMAGEAAFNEDRYDVALKAYEQALPLLGAANGDDKTNCWLSTLHAAQCANKLKDHEKAKTLAQSLASDETANELLRLDANLELGIAAQKLNEVETALQAWAASAQDVGLTGVRSRYMLGAAKFASGDYEDAISQFTLARNGYGSANLEQVNPWRALSTYEIARVKYLMAVAAKSESEKQSLLKDAIYYFQKLIDDFPGDANVAEAKREIEKINAFVK